MHNLKDTFRTKFLFWGSILNIIIMPFFCHALDLDKEIEDFQNNLFNANYQEALFSLENILNSKEVENLDLSVKGILFCYAGSCSSHLDEFEKSNQYYNRALLTNTLSDDLIMDVLCGLLQNYDVLDQQKESREIETILCETFKSNKKLYVLDKLMAHFLHIQEYDKIIQFESDLPFLIQDTSNELNILSNSLAWDSVYTSLAYAYYEKQNYLKSLEYLFKQLNSLTDFNKSEARLIYQVISECYEKLGDRENALKYKKLAMEYN